MNLENALKIKGWTYDVELEWLAEQASRRNRIVEIGSWMGRSTRAICDNTDGVVYAVDTFLGTAEDGHMKELEGKDKDWLYKEFLANMKGCKNLYPKRGKSTDIAETFKTAMKVDMVFIDGDHSYEAAREDILAWSAILAPHGLLCGHDFDAGRPGVVRAVRELVPDIGKGPGSIWFAK